MKKILTFTLAVLLMQTAFVHQIFAETKEESLSEESELKLPNSALERTLKLKSS